MEAFDDLLEYLGYGGSTLQLACEDLRNLEIVCDRLCSSRNREVTFESGRDWLVHRIAWIFQFDLETMMVSEEEMLECS